MGGTMSGKDLLVLIETLGKDSLCSCFQTSVWKKGRELPAALAVLLESAGKAR